MHQNNVRITLYLFYISYVTDALGEKSRVRDEIFRMRLNISWVIVHQTSKRIKHLQNTPDVVFPASRRN